MSEIMNEPVASVFADRPPVRVIAVPCIGLPVALLRTFPIRLPVVMVGGVVLSWGLKNNIPPAVIVAGLVMG